MGIPGRKLGRLFLASHFLSSICLSLYSPQPTMSTAPSTSTSQSNFVSIFNAALESYKRKTKNDLPSHPLLPSLQSCHSPEAVLTVLREQVPAFNQSQNDDDGFTRWVTPTVNVLQSFSETIGQGVGLVNFHIFFAAGNFCPNIIHRHSQRQIQSLQGLVFSFRSVSYISPLCDLF